MKKISFLIFALFVSVEAFAYCALSDRSECPKTVCPPETFMGDDGQCYSCDTDESVRVKCIGYEKAFELCPNRIFPRKGCGTVISHLCPKNTCPANTFMGDDGKCYSCDEGKEIDINCIGREIAKEACLNRIVMDCYGNLSFKKCKDGYKRWEYNMCCKNGECWDYMCPRY